MGSPCLGCTGRDLPPKMVDTAVRVDQDSYVHVSKYSTSKPQPIRDVRGLGHRLTFLNSLDPIRRRFGVCRGSWVFPSCRLDPSFGVCGRQPFPGCRALSSADCAPWNKINVGFSVRFFPLAGLHPLASCISSGLACELPLPTWDDQEERSEICGVQSVYAGVDDLACHRRGRSQGRW